MLSVAIMGHPSRRRFIEGLSEELPEAEVVLDRRDDRWETGRRALLAFDPDADFHLVVQDDAILCRDLPAGALAAAEAAGERPVALYTGRARPRRHTVARAVRRARASGSPWLAMEGPLWGVAIVLPTVHIPELVQWCDANPVPNYDRRIASFYERTGIECWYTLPSLVDHRPVAENPSLIAGRTGNRRAHWFIGSERSAAELDFSGEPVRPEAALEFRHKRDGRRIIAALGTPLYARLERSGLWSAIDPEAPPPWLPRRESPEAPEMSAERT